MFKLMGNKRLILLMFALIFFIALMGLTLGKKLPMSWPEHFVKDTVSFTQGLIYKPAGYIAGFFEDIRDLRSIYKENKVLKKTLSNYARDSARLNDLEAQNDRLKIALGFTDRQKKAHDYIWHIAEVVSDSNNAYEDTITINIGSKDGVHENMAVASVDGLIGRIKRVQPFSSNVQLLTDMDLKDNNTKAISATVVGRENESFGMIESYDPTKGSGMLIMNKIDPEDPMKVGDTVVTSGLGSVFPRGIVIGKIVSRKEGDFGITHTAYIEPAARFQHLTEVFVVETPGQ